MAWLEPLANFASILTALVAAGASAYYYCDQHSKRAKLEAYLQSEKLANPDRHVHTVLHLMAKLGMTEEEILRASFNSHHIIRKIREDPDTRLASEILFAYQDKSIQR